MTYYLATSNAGKVRDFAGMAPEIDWGLLPGFDSLPPAEETGTTFEANARLKAEHYSALVDLPVVADDSGLEVYALGGEPGVYSARYAGRHGDDEANNRLVLEKMKGVPESQRGGAFVAVLALARRGRTIATFTGRSEGVILATPRGTGGFGYDPLFFSPAAIRGFAELTPEEKARYSHRGVAARALRAWILEHEAEAAVEGR